MLLYYATYKLFAIMADLRSLVTFFQKSGRSPMVGKQLILQYYIGTYKSATHIKDRTIYHLLLLFKYILA